MITEGQNRFSHLHWPSIHLISVLLLQQRFQKSIHRLFHAGRIGSSAVIQNDQAVVIT